MSHLHEFLSAPAFFETSLLFIAIIAGFIGAILGLGGGVVIIPALTLLFGVNIRYAVGASIVSVIATSSGAAATYVKDHITNIKVAMILEMATTLGALTGVVLSAHISGRSIYVIFAMVLIYSSLIMLRKRKSEAITPEESDSWAKKLRLSSKYPDAQLKREVEYGVRNIPLGLTLMSGAGVMSGLLGIGSGALKVPAMDSAMGLPIKVSSATSNFMIGVTGAASAGTYYMKGDILPILAAPVALGVFVGSWFGTKAMVHLPGEKIRKIFVIFLLITAVQLIFKAFGVDVR